jgi:hypothetical protein
MDETHRYFVCDPDTYTQLASAVDQSRGYPHGAGTRAVTLRGLPTFDELELANDNSGRGLIAIDKWRFTPSDDELLAPAIGAGLIEELTLSEYQNLKTEIMP